jgi:hypothetical protein
LDEIFLTIHGEHHDLWRAVDQDGHVLDILVPRRRDKKAAKKFFRKLLKGLTYVPRVIIPDKLRSYGAAKQEILPSVEHRQHHYLNNRAGNSHQPTRQREQRMQGFQVPGIRPALSRRVWHHCIACPSPAPPLPRSRIPPPNDPEIPDMAGDHKLANGRIREERGAVLPPLCLVIALGSQVQGVVAM